MEGERASAAPFMLIVNVNTLQRRLLAALEIAAYEEGVYPTHDGDLKAVARMAAFRPQHARSL